MTGSLPRPPSGPVTFWRGLGATYAGSLAFLAACPLLALVPVAFELIQHGVEVRIGMYASIAAARALEHDPWRMGFGFLKVAGLMVPGYWIVRFLAWRDARIARAWDGRAVRLFAGYLAVGLAMAAVQLFALPTTGWAVAATLLAGQVISCLLPAWGVAAALGDARMGTTIGIGRSIAIMARQLPWTFAFLLVAMLPLMIPHYVLGAVALVGPRGLMWPVLIADSLLVGWLTAVIDASAFVAAVRAAERAGVALVPAPAGAAGLATRPAMT